MARSFKARTATRTKIPLIISLVGPSGTGKTKSALRLADGIARKSPGRTVVIDTERDRSLAYAKEHAFEIVSFGPPHSPDDYAAAIADALSQGAKRIIIDSMSHEHDGTGGVLEMHKQAHQAMGGQASKQLLAWAGPKQARRRLINVILGADCDFILCFKAKPKIRPIKGGEPLQLGWMPITGPEFKYEANLQCLLLPGANGVPTWQSNFEGERDIVKCPGQFRPLFTKCPQLSEDLGEP